MQTSINSCIHTILHIHWPDTTWSSDLLQRTNQEKDEVGLGTLRTNRQLTVIEVDPRGQEGAFLKHLATRTVGKYLKYTCNKMERMAQARGLWRLIVVGPYSNTSQERKYRFLLRLIDSVVMVLFSFLSYYVTQQETLLKSQSREIYFQSQTSN